MLSHKNIPLVVTYELPQIPEELLDARWNKFLNDAQND